MNVRHTSGIDRLQLRMIMAGGGAMFLLESGWASLKQQNWETLVSPVIFLHIFPLEWLIAGLWWIEEASPLAPFYHWWSCAFCDASLEEAYYGVSHPESLSPGCQDGCRRQGGLLHCAITSFSWNSEDHGQLGLFPMEGRGRRVLETFGGFWWSFSSLLHTFQEKDWVLDSPGGLVWKNWVQLLRCSKMKGFAGIQ